MTRSKYVLGNQKTNLTADKMGDLFSEFFQCISAEQIKQMYQKRSIIGIAPTEINIPCVSEYISQTEILLGAQNVSADDMGAHTGETAIEQFQPFGTKFFIVGHSERRANGENSAIISRKVEKVVNSGKKVCYCCGEDKHIRSQKATMDFINLQLKEDLQFISASDILAGFVIIAYEPIWAIGTGNTATPDQAEVVCASIRQTICEMFGEIAADAVPILYGGSVNSKNCLNLFSQKNIDGGLIGGACLKGAEFAKICSTLNKI